MKNVKEVREFIQGRMTLYSKIKDAATDVEVHDFAYGKWSVLDEVLEYLETGKDKAAQ